MQRGSVSFATVITRVHTYLSKVVYLILLLKIYTYWRSDFPVRNFAVQWTTIYVRVTKYRIAQKTVNQTHSDRNFDANKVRPANVYSSTLDLKLGSACRKNFRGGGVIAKLRKATISFVMTICQCVSVCVCVCVCVCVWVRPSTCNNSAPTGRIFMKFDIFFKNLSTEFKFHQNSNNGYFTRTAIHRRTAVSMGNAFQELPRLRETADNTERYI